MTVACADSALSPYIPGSLLQHPFDRSSHYFSLGSNLFCATRPGFIIQRVYLSNNASQVVTDDDTEILRRICEDTLGVVTGTEGTSAAGGSAVRIDTGGQLGQAEGERTGPLGNDGQAHHPNVGRAMGSAERVKRDRRSSGTREQSLQYLDARSPADAEVSGSTVPSSVTFARALRSTATGPSPTSPHSTTTPSPSASNRAELIRAATYSNKEGVWVVDVCAIPPQLLEQDDLVFPPPPQQQTIGEVDAAVSGEQSDGGEGEEEEGMDADAKALEERRKERMVMIIQALEGSGVQGMSVAGSKKTSAAVGNAAALSGKVRWTVGLAILGSVGLAVSAV